MIHRLKIWPEPFEELRLGAKTFEVRREDRQGQRFEGGDVLRLQEWDPNRGPTGRTLDVQVTSTLRLYDTPPAWNINCGMVVVMAVRPLGGGEDTADRPAK